MHHLRAFISLCPPSEQRGSTDTNNAVVVFAPTCDNG